MSQHRSLGLQNLLRLASTTWKNERREGGKREARAIKVEWSGNLKEAAHFSSASMACVDRKKQHLQSDRHTEKTKPLRGHFDALGSGCGKTVELKQKVSILGDDHVILPNRHSKMNVPCPDPRHARRGSWHKGTQCDKTLASYGEILLSHFKAPDKWNAALQCHCHCSRYLLSRYATGLFTKPFQRQKCHK